MCVAVGVQGGHSTVSFMEGPGLTHWQRGGGLGAGWGGVQPVQGVTLGSPSHANSTSQVLSSLRLAPAPCPSVGRCCLESRRIHLTSGSSSAHLAGWGGRAGRTELQAAAKGGWSEASESPPF